MQIFSYEQNHHFLHYSPGMHDITVSEKDTETRSLESLRSGPKYLGGSHVICDQFLY
jgi:hypothetical protein